jgi:cytochrome c biogenesis protein CcdA
MEEIEIRDIEEKDVEEGTISTNEIKEEKEETNDEKQIKIEGEEVIISPLHCKDPELSSVEVKVPSTNKKRKKRFLVAGLVVLSVIGFFFLAKMVSSGWLKEIGAVLPLPVFTFLIAFVDGFNPCNLFVLTLLLGLLVSASHSRKRIYVVGYTFVFMVFVIYFLFMVAWLNIFKFIGFIDPLRIGIAGLALAAGLINCKEIFWFRKGITLMIQEKHKGPLLRKVEGMKSKMMSASMPALIFASVGLAAFSSFVELPCTAGFPIIYSSVLAGKFMTHSFWSYTYLLFYNLIYVLPLAVIIGIVGYTFQGKQISKKQMGVIKLIGGLIMIALGIILLVNPGLVMG